MIFLFFTCYPRIIYNVCIGYGIKNFVIITCVSLFNPCKLSDAKAPSGRPVLCVGGETLLLLSLVVTLMSNLTEPKTHLVT